MRSLLVFGDSNSWGLDPETRRRLPHARRWPSLLAAGLGDAHVVAEGQPGRTTMLDDPRSEIDRNGARALPVLLASHFPLDRVILMLGTNDLKAHLGGTPESVATGMAALVRIVRDFPYTHGAGRPDITVVSPPHLAVGPSSRLFPLFPDSNPASRLLAGALARVAETHGCGFVDAAAAVRVSDHDGAHMDAAAHARLAEHLVGVIGPH